MNQPLISVIVPIYGIERYVGHCIESLMQQTYQNLEIILVDDGSPDRCPQICDLYASKDKRIKVIHKENGGIVTARKAGVQIAQGEYIGFVDGDDWVGSGYFQSMFRRFRKAKRGWRRRRSYPPPSRGSRSRRRSRRRRRRKRRVWRSDRWSLPRRSRRGG